MFYALEITRVYEFEDIKDREAFLSNRPISRMIVCPECARKMLSKRKDNAFLREFQTVKAGKRYETVDC